jgi:phage terminase large subunit
MTKAPIQLNYQPREAFVPFHKRQQRWSCLVAHRRAGKTVACVMDLIDAAIFCTKPEPRFAYVAPYYAQAKDVAWSYVKSAASQLPGATLNESELRVDFPNGGRVRLYGADNYDRMRGIYLDGIVLDEYADMDPRAWPEVLRPALSDRKGWASFIGTPKGRNAFHDVFRHSESDPDWFSLMLRASETGLLSEDELADAKRSMSPEQYAQEYECSFEAAIVGAFYGAQMADLQSLGQITGVAQQPGIPVQTAWDLGVRDSTAIWCFQTVGSEIHVIDHIEDHGKPLAFYHAELESRGYDGASWLPHDANARELGTGRTRIETLRNMGRDCRIVPSHKVMDGITAVRQILPNCWFDESRTSYGRECLINYRSEFDDKNRTFRATPLHNWASHSADAFRYLAMAWLELGGGAVKPTEAKPDKWDRAFEREDEVDEWRVI